MPHTQDTRQERHTNTSSQKTRTVHTFSSAAYLEELMGELNRAAICQRIQTAREEAGLTQPELGDALHPSVHWRTIQTWESVKQPRVPWDRLDEIARITARTKEWLLHGEAAIPDGDHLGALEELVAEGFAAVDRRLERLEERLLPAGDLAAEEDADG